MTSIPRLRDGDRLVLASHNKGKLVEFQELFEPFGLEIISAAELDLPEPEETGTTFAENARIKAHAAAQASGMLALSDDSGLCVDALGGDPGVYTADWAGVPRNFEHAMKRVEDALQAANATSPNQRRGYFNATLCLAHPDGRDELFVGRCDGTLVWPPRGERGHGYDPVFMPDGYDITFGQMAAEAKHSWAPGQQGLSHRARAFSKFVEDQIAKD
ncbi:non-canonical purine NTP pyrophosphatase [Devosia neptuniae]|jgi:XTP/dITP diphosphohydrolase|uniref:dITP/XTP pyrophosphatase n=1 Tax=Devosia neptuniae TaxID=191302 RepID=A0ABY6CHR3_9HYPH|nr:non-canonical purine NTP pyrophosphatase [Devosia neptuniae]UXN71348.1 non-canonical purine NTP pyrophosphatase [Devosia neptuniae]